MPTPTPDDFLLGSKRRKEFSRDIGQDWNIRQVGTDLVGTYKPTGANYILAPGSAGGQIGYAQVTSSQTGITSITDLTGLSVAVTIGSGRRIRVTGFAPQFARTAGTVGYVNYQIFEGTTQLSLVTITIPNNYGGGIVSWVNTPSAGSHTYKLRAETDGTVTHSATPNWPAYILVEDIGAA